MALLESRRKLLQETTLCIFKLYEFVILQQFLSLNLVVIHINNIFFGVFLSLIIYDPGLF